MKVKHLMTSPAVTTSPATPLKDAITLLANRGISALPVVDAEGHLLGIVSESDLIQVLSVAGSEAQSGVVGDLMTADVISVDEETGLPEVARRLLDSKVRRVPVLKEERVAGIVSRRDLIKWMARSDAVLATDVCGVLRDEGQRLSQLEVAVHQGVAHIKGAAGGDTLALAAMLARSVPGIIGVRVNPDEEPM